MREPSATRSRQFHEVPGEGYGHADEQLINLPTSTRPELFDWYLGDYQEMITNYARVYQRPERPLGQLITNSFAAKDWAVCARASEILGLSPGGRVPTLGCGRLALAKVRAVAADQLRVSA